MLSACAGSPSPRPAADPDPIVETRTVTKTVCPAELLLPIPGEIAPPAEAVIEASQAVMDWLGARWRREALLADRLADAAAECP